MGGEARQYWISFLLRMCEGWCHLKMRGTRRVRCRSWSSESAAPGSGKKRGGRRRRRWVPGRNSALGEGDIRCSHPPPPSWHRQNRRSGRVMPSFGLSFVFLCELPWCAFTLSWDRPGRRAKGSFQRVAGRGLRTGTGLYTPSP